MYKFSSRVMRASLAAAGSALLMTAASLGLSATAALAADITPAQVDANYKIALNGFDLGTFRFSSDVERDHYAVEYRRSCRDFHSSRISACSIGRA